MAVYEITWHVEISDDDAARQIYDSMNRIVAATVTETKATLTLKKVLS